MSEAAKHEHLPKRPDEATEPAAQYFRAADRDISLFHFIIDTVLASDYVAHVARRALDDTKEVGNLTPSELARTAPGPRTTFLRRQRQALLEMFVSRLVDNFQTYLVDLVRAVLRSKPQMLSSRQRSVSLEMILKYDRMEDLLHAVIERKVTALSYEGFAELHTWCSERGLDIAVTEEQKAALVELIATRNVIAHSRGCIDDRYLFAVRATRFKWGDPRSLEVDDLFAAIRLLHAVVVSTDSSVADKFSLERAPLASTEAASKSRPPESHE